jgi:hypothetical protein
MDKAILLEQHCPTAPRIGQNTNTGQSFLDSWGVWIFNLSKERVPRVAPEG